MSMKFDNKISKWSQYSTDHNFDIFGQHISLFVVIPSQFLKSRIISFCFFSMKSFNLKDQFLLLIFFHNFNFRVATVHKTVQKYCLIEENSDFHVKRSFKNPTKADVLHCQIVVATLSTSRMLSTIGLPIGLFSHIFIDEAAQVN